MDRLEWLAQRRTGIGASDAPVICGLSPWSSPYVLWLDKTGRLPLDTGNGSAAMGWGKRLEAVILDAFTEQTGMPVHHRGEFVRHDDNPWMVATLDGLVSDGGDNPIGVVEAKTSNGRDGQWRDGVPEHVQIQVQHQLEVTGLDVAWVPVLLGGQEFVVHELARDDAAIEILLDMENHFWHHNVLADVPPPMDGNRRTADALSRAYPGEGGLITVLDRASTNAVELAGEYLSALADESAAEARKQGAKNALCALLGDAETLRVGDEVVARWTVSDRTTFDVATFAAEHPELHRSYVRTYPQRRFSVPKEQQP